MRSTVNKAFGGRSHKMAEKETFAPRMERILLSCDPAELSVARRFIRDTLSNHSGDLVYYVQLCATEIVTNAIRHSDTKAKGGKIMLVVVELADRIRVEVLDHGSETDEPHTDGCEDLYAEGGRGLFVVDSFCDSRGSSTDSDGRNVWFEVVIH